MSMDLMQSALISPITLCFVLGAIAAFLRSDLKLPEPVFMALSIYLMLAIGLKGGADLAKADLVAMLPALTAALLLASGIPLWIYAALRGWAGYSQAEAAALAAHYGSVSAVTFIAAMAYVEAAGLAYEGYVTALLAVMEVPAIIVALILAKRGTQAQQPLGAVLRVVLSSKSVVLLCGGLLIGYCVGPVGLAPVSPLFGDLFRGLLCLFLLELGNQAARHLVQSGWQQLRPSLPLLAIVAPLFNACIGLLAGFAAGMSVGGTVILATLAASASYIVAPAAIRLALPDLSPATYLTPALAITFPFNLLIGLPLYALMAGWLFG